MPLPRADFFRSGEQLDAPREGLRPVALAGVALDTQLRDRAHKPQQTFAHALIACVRAAQIALMDAMLFGLGNAVPGVEDQQIVDAPILQSERRQLDNINQFARLDKHMLIRLDIDRAQAFRRISGHGHRLCIVTVTVNPFQDVTNPSQDVAEAIPRSGRTHPRT